MRNGCCVFVTATCRRAAALSGQTTEREDEERDHDDAAEGAHNRICPLPPVDRPERALRVAVLIVRVNGVRSVVRLRSVGWFVRVRIGHFNSSWVTSWSAVRFAGMFEWRVCA